MVSATPAGRGARRAGSARRDDRGDRAGPRGGGAAADQLRRGDPRRPRDGLAGDGRTLRRVRAPARPHPRRGQPGLAQQRRRGGGGARCSRCGSGRGDRWRWCRSSSSSTSRVYPFAPSVAVYLWRAGEHDRARAYFAANGAPLEHDHGHLAARLEPRGRAGALPRRPDAGRPLLRAARPLRRAELAAPGPPWRSVRSTPTSRWRRPPPARRTWRLGTPTTPWRLADGVGALAVRRLVVGAAPDLRFLTRRCPRSGPVKKPVWRWRP